MRMNLKTSGNLSHSIMCSVLYAVYCIRHKTFCCILYCFNCSIAQLHIYNAHNKHFAAAAAESEDLNGRCELNWHRVMHFIPMLLTTQIYRMECGIFCWVFCLLVSARHQNNLHSLENIKYGMSVYLQRNCSFCIIFICTDGVQQCFQG